MSRPDFNDIMVTAAIGVPAVYLAAVRYGRLSKNFTIWEMIQSDAGGVQWPSPIIIGNMRNAAQKVFQPARDLVGPMKVTSGFRTKGTNRLIGGSSTSDHVKGTSIDFITTRMSISEAFEDISNSGILFDQLIYYPPGYSSDSGHIHIGWRPEGPRRSAWIAGSR